MRPLRKTIIAGFGRYSAGAFHAPGKPLGELESRSPSDPEDLLGTFPYGQEDIGEAVDSAADGAARWRATPLTSRLNLLRRLERELTNRLPELTARLGREQGRPPWECARECHGLLARLAHTLTGAKALLEDQGFDDLDARLTSRPLGVVAVIGPAMLPISTSHTHIIAALVAGNSVIWKPSPLAAASAQLYTEAMAAVGLPVGTFNLVQGDEQVGRALASHPGVDGVVFTGSRANGLDLRRRLADRLDVQLVLHLGAKNPALVMENADLERAAREIVTSAFLSSGQRCTAISRVLVHNAVLGRFLELLLEAVKRLRVGPPGMNTFMGPMLSKARRDAFQAAMARAETDGASILHTGTVRAATGFYAPPSVHLVQTRQPEAAYQRDEHFGPDLTVVPVKDFEDALDVAELSPYGLCASLFSIDRKRWDAFAGELRAGVLFWNRGTTSPSGRLPFGGLKQSGNGIAGGGVAMNAMRRQVPLLWGSGQSFPGTGQGDAGAEEESQ